MIRGLEIDPAVADGPQSCIIEQVTNGVAVRMALLFLLMGTPVEEQATANHSVETKTESTGAGD